MSEKDKTKEVELTLEQRFEALFAKLKAKQAEVANAERPQWITNGQFRYSETNGMNIDLMTEKNEHKLVTIIGFLRERAHYFEVGNKEAGTDLKFTWLSFTPDEWISDVLTRLSALQITKKRSELAELEKRVNAAIPPEIRREMEIKALEAAL